MIIFLLIVLLRLDLLTVNALTASHSVIIPVQCEYFALEGLGKLLNTIKIIQNNLNPELEIEGFLLTMYDSRLRLSNQVADEVNKHFQQMVFKTIIQRNVKLSEAPSFGQPAILYDADSRGTVNYLNLAKELIEKAGSKSKSSIKIITFNGKRMNMTKKNALGRGLGALIDGVEKEVLEKKVEANQDISVDSIDANPFQPRTTFDEQSLEELAASIRKLGIVQPLTVRETGSGRYQLIAGERRLRAARLAGLTHVPAYIRTADDQAMLNLHLLKIFSVKTLMQLRLQ